MSSLQEGAVRLHLQWSKLKKKTSSDLSTVVVTDCKIYDYMYINPQWHITWWCIVKRTFSSSIKQHSWNRHSFLNYDALPKKKTLHHGKDQVLAHPWKKKQKFIPLWPTQDDKIDTSPALKKRELSTPYYDRKCFLPSYLSLRTVELRTPDSAKKIKGAKLGYRRNSNYIWCRYRLHYLW